MSDKLDEENRLVENGEVVTKQQSSSSKLRLFVSIFIIALMAIVFISTSFSGHSQSDVPSSSSSSVSENEEEETVEEEVKTNEGETTGDLIEDKVELPFGENDEEGGIEPDDQLSLEQDDELVKEDEERKKKSGDTEEEDGEVEPIDAAIDTEGGGPTDTEIVDTDVDTELTEDQEEEEHTSGYPTIATNRTSLEYYAELCKIARAKNFPVDSVDYKIAAANCGWGYDYKNSAGKEKHWLVYLYGRNWRPEIIDLSGCEVFCPLSPKCKIKTAGDKQNLAEADVVVVFQADVNHVLNEIPLGRHTTNVIYWREAKFKSPSAHGQHLFDFEMGVHFYSGLLNPTFLRTPVQLLSRQIYPYPPLEFLPFEKRTKFALSLISDCDASSLRDQYLDQMMSHLGPNRLHRYGKCGDRDFPPRPINNAAKLISEYKFYMAMENTIQDGYITEKLFFVLNFPVVPVYYGALNVPNVTKIPSFIKAIDFHNPKELSNYLLYLDANPDEYNKYHEWRWKPELFNDEYLETLAHKVAGPEELLEYKKRKYRRFPRSAQCCRLCDRKFVEYAKKQRSPQSIVSHTFNGRVVEQHFFRHTPGV